MREGTMSEQAAKAEKLLQLHHGPKILVLPNAWDAASARIFEDAGFPAIATTSAGVAFSLGYPDGQFIPPNEMLAAVKKIASSVKVPVTADLEAGYGDPAKTAAAAIEAGAVGLNIEDFDHASAALFRSRSKEKKSERGAAWRRPLAFRW